MELKKLNSWRHKHRVFITSLMVSGCSLIGCIFAGCSVITPGIPYGTGERLVTSGVQSLREGDLEKAAASFTLAYEVDKSAASLDGLGCVQLRRGDREVAKAYFEEALSLDETYAPAYAHLALYYESKREYSKAIQSYQDALQLDPLHVEARGNFARLLHDKGYTALASHEAQKALMVHISGVER